MRSKEACTAGKSGAIRFFQHAAFDPGKPVRFARLPASDYSV